MQGLQIKQIAAPQFRHLPLISGRSIYLFQGKQPIICGHGGWETSDNTAVQLFMQEVKNNPPVGPFRFVNSHSVPHWWVCPGSRRAISDCAPAGHKHMEAAPSRSPHGHIPKAPELCQHHVLQAGSNRLKLGLHLCTTTRGFVGLGNGRDGGNGLMRSQWWTSTALACSRSLCCTPTPGSRYTNT